jgi:hypothetical protein
MKLPVLTISYAPCKNSEVIKVFISKVYVHIKLLVYKTCHYTNFQDAYALSSQTAQTSSTATLSHHHVLVAETICEDSVLVDIKYRYGL